MHTAVSTVVGECHCSRLIRGRLRESTDGENIVQLLCVQVLTLNMQTGPVGQAVSSPVPGSLRISLEP